MRRLNFYCQAVSIPVTYNGADFLIPAGDTLGVSSGVRQLPLRLAAVSIHSKAINCSDALGRRWTLLTDPGDFLPRSVLLSDLPRVRRGDFLLVGLPRTAAVFQTRLLNAEIGERWLGLVGEWQDLLSDRELAPLRNAVEEGAPVHALSGLGPGFTPAGDDFIAGWLAARRSGGTADARAEVRRFYEGWNQQSTTWFSRWMIRDAARGRIWRRGLVLLEAMSRGSGVKEALDGILNWGHTSGRAWLAGFARGFSPRRAGKEMIFCKG